MHHRPVVFLVLFTVCLSACNRDEGNYQSILPSPDFDVHIYFQLYKGYPYYMAYYKEQRIFDWSAMGFVPDNGIMLDREMNRMKNNDFFDETMDTTDTTIPFFRDRNYNSLIVHLRSAKSEKAGYSIEFRAFEDGFGFRYILFPGMDPAILIPSEKSEFALTDRKTFFRSESRNTAGISSSQSLTLPVRFISGQNEKVEILEPESNTDFRTQLVPKEGKTNVFLSSVKHAGETGRKQKPSRVTPWRMVRITKVNDPGGGPK